ncbi:RagB/SusD domain-containing protein [Russula earlei]|uniref:RagB/SusD domain-containing protein n=1 Tax=Russula earlei TaxID=71964 RepID=A0ACC0U675_9AGAM|nr:RagB/SusD domain-containing protein [Russula earlei]
MKRIIHIPATLAVLLLFQQLLFSSCSKNFIDLTDPTRIVSSDYYQDSTSVAAGVIAAYATLQGEYGRAGSNNRGIFPFAEVASDNSYSVIDATGIGDFEYFTTTSANVNVQSMWVATYKSIATCNILLSRAPSVKMTPATLNRYMAEVKFIRALVYFNAVRIWGDVPLVTREISSITDAYVYGRTSQDSVYQQIIKDLTDAEPVLPVKYASANDLGRVTQGAVKGLLAKVYLTQNDYTNAANKLNEFITLYDNSTYSLQTTYANIFSTTNEMNSEIIFAVRYTKGGYGTGSPFTNYFAPNASVTGGIGNAGQYNLVRKDLVDTFLANGASDTRYAAAIGFYTGTGVYYTKKYTDVPASDGDADCDWIVLRYADVLLMYAEALNEQSAANVALAIPYINRVRARAGITALSASTQTQASLRLAIEDERKLELNMEGHRWFDLVRTGRAVTVMNNHFTKYQIKNGTVVVSIQPYQTLFPIPLSEINTNPILKQNTGYN